MRDREHLLILVLLLGMSSGLASSGQGGPGGATPQEPAVPPPEKSPARSFSGRDPFLLPKLESGPGVALPRVVTLPGKRGLVIGQLKLEGVVRHPGGMIAVVDDARNRALFLRENDVLYDGMVVKINWDSVVFRENVLDREGQVTTREVIRRLSPAPGEER